MEKQYKLGSEFFLVQMLGDLVTVEDWSGLIAYISACINTESGEIYYRIKVSDDENSVKFGYAPEASLDLACRGILEYREYIKLEKAREDLIKYINSLSDSIPIEALINDKCNSPDNRHCCRHVDCKSMSCCEHK